MSVYREHQLKAVLDKAVQGGGLGAAILTDSQGLPLAEVESTFDGHILSGLSALFEDSARRAEGLLGWPYVEEVSLVDKQGNRLVTRQFKVQDRWYILVVIVPNRGPYRRATNRCLRQLKPLLYQAVEPALELASGGGP